MKNLRGIFLIFFVFFSFFTGCIRANNKAFASKNVNFSTINLISQKKDIAINSKAIEQGFCTLADNSVVAYSLNRGIQNNLGSSGGCIAFLNNYFDILSGNLYSNSYQDSSAIGISLLLFEIQPNAP